MAASASDFVGGVLASFGLPAEIDTPDLAARSDGTRIVIGDDPATWPFPVRTVSSPSLAQIKTWIGNPDATVQQHGVKLVAAADLARIAADTTDPDQLSAAARQYVFGDSAAAAHLLPAIEKHLGPFEVHLVAASVIKIAPGQTLVFEGSTPKVVTADQLIFEGPGANIESFVNLSMTVQTVIVN
ncbi:hypothetical protein RNZ50_00760 [Paracoccaceae bacterium Fryx2]|nr:hypothetical protein [Paracoccaceae bacterium Fryx2]